jgi:hypothetical protein
MSTRTTPRNNEKVVSGQWSVVGFGLFTDHRPPTTFSEES